MKALLFLVGVLAAVQARVLTRKTLDTAAIPTSPYDNSEFLPQGNNGPSNINLEGVLTFSGLDNTSNSLFTEIWTDPDPSTAYPQPFNVPSRRVLPPFSFSYFTTGSNDILPERAGFIPNPVPNVVDSPYEYILSPSRVWHEPSDKGFARVVIVFAITERHQNCVYNGLATFLIHPGTKETSRVFYQITNHFCGYYQFSLWGFGSVTYTPGTVAGKAEAAQRFSFEKANRLEVKSIADLPADFGSEEEWTLSSNPIIEYDEHSDCSPFPWYRYVFPFYGVVTNQKFYRGIVGTDSGPHPYPEYFVVPAYSWTKSNYMSLLAGALDHQVGCNFKASPSATVGDRCLLDLVVSDWIPQANDGTWDNVTVGNLLNMGGVRYGSLTYGVDEGSLAQNINFFYSYTDADKLAFSLSGFAFHADASVNTNFIYHSTDFYIVSRLVDNVVQDKYGVDSLAFYHEHVVTPLNLSELFAKAKVTDDLEQIPFGSYGMFMYPDDAAKLASFWSSSGGQVGSTRVVSAAYYADALQMNAASRGVLTLRTHKPASTCYPYGPSYTIPNQRYHLGFWSDDSMGEAYTGVATTCDNNKLVFESGYGGGRMMLAPNVQDPQKAWALLQWTDNYDFKTFTATATLANLIGCPNGLVHD